MPLLKIDQWNGGLSDGELLGVPGAYYYAKGLDYKRNPDVITANLALVKDSGSTVVDMPKWGAYDSVAKNHYFCGHTGHMYKRTVGGVWSDIRTVANSSGQGLEIFNDYLYYTQNSQLGRYGALSGSPSFTDNYQTSLNGTTSWRPLKGFLNLLLVGNGQYLATLSSGGTWTAQKLTFPPGWYVRDIDVMGDYAAIAVNDSADINLATRGILFLWDGASSTFNSFSELNEGGGISSIQANQDSVVIQGGIQGNAYLYTGRVNKIKKIPFIPQGTVIQIYPGADSNLGGYNVFGISETTSSATNMGVYSYGSPNITYPQSLSFDYPISTGTTNNVNVNVSMVMTYGNQLFVGWRDNGVCGIDLLSRTVLQTSVSYKSLHTSFDTEAEFTRFKLYMYGLSAGQSISLYYYGDREAQTLIGTASSSSDGAVTFKLFNKEFIVTDIQFELVLSGTTSSMPTVIKLVAEYRLTNAL